MKGNVTLTVEFQINAESVRDAEKWLDLALIDWNDYDDLVQYEVVKTEWESIVRRPTAGEAADLALLRQGTGKRV